MLSGSMRPEMLHTIVDTFVEGKKAQVKQRMRQAMETVLDDLFGEMLNQLKGMLLPALEKDPDRLDSDTASSPSRGERQTVEAPKKSGPKSPQSRRPVFAVKSKAGPSSHPADGGKRPHEPDIEHSGDDQASSDQHQEEITATKKARTEPVEYAAVLDFDLQNNSDNDNSGPAPPLPVHEPLAKFVCSSPGCGKRFMKSCNLKNHERLHSGLTPFSCKFPGCSHTSKERSHVIRHIRSVHLKHLEAGQEDDPKKYLEVNNELLK